jgi:pimeloyl-ACP methyl ester carboxylesterase
MALVYNGAMFRLPTPQSTGPTVAAGATISAHTHEALAISYLRAGEAGPAVVMLHGWGAFKELWWSTLLALGRDHRCFALDIPGHGKSPLGRAASIAGLAEAVAAFCDSLGLEQIALIGHSMGGSVACDLALRRPDLIRRLVLVDPAIDARRMPGFSRTYLLPSYGWALFRLMLLGARISRPIGMRVPHEHGGGWLRPWLRRGSYLAGFEPEPLHRLYRSLFAAEAGGRLAQITQPTLVISGQLDSVVPPSLSRRLAKQIPGARYVEIQGALHNPMDERPRAFERALREFLEQKL